MYYANCEWYVDMGEHNKPLCERKNLRPAKCSECPVYVRSIEDENAKLREQIELLTTILRNDCDIDASWDGMRRFWSIGLTESGCLMRDRACKAEAENAKLREFAESYLDAVAMAGCHFCPYDDIDLCDTETDPMRDGCRLYEEMRELGIEVNE